MESNLKDVDLIRVAKENKTTYSTFSCIVQYRIQFLRSQVNLSFDTPHVELDGGTSPSWNATLHFAILALHVLLRSERVLDDRNINEVYIPLKEFLGGVTSADNSSGYFVSYQVRKPSSGKPKGILNLSYKFVKASPAATPAALPVVPHSFLMNETKANVPSIAYLAMPSYPLPAACILYPPVGLYSPLAAAAVGSKHGNPAEATTAHLPPEKDEKESKIGEPVTAYPATGGISSCGIPTSVLVPALPGAIRAVLETVARVTSKKNDTKEKSFQFHDVFNLDNENQAEDTPTLIDRKDNVFIISNPKSKYPVLQLDLRLISDLVVVIVSATCGGIAFACLGQPVITGYLLAGSVIGPGGLKFVSEMVQVETVAQFGVIFLLFALGLEFSAAKLRVVRAVAVLGGLLQIFLFMCLCGITASVLKFLMERNSANALHGQVTIGTLILQDCAVGLLFAFLPVLGGTSGILQGVISMTKSLIVLFTFLAVLSIVSRKCMPWFLKLMISLSSQTNELYQLASVAFCLLVAWDFSPYENRMHPHLIEPIRNFFAALFLASIGMLIHVHFLWNHVDILLAAVILVIIIKTIVVAAVVKGFGYTNKTSLLVGMSLAQIGEFAFVLLSRASNLHLIEVTTPLLFKLIPAVIHLGVLLRWFSPDSSQAEMGFKGESIRADSGKRITLLVQGSHDS
ncbi:putative K(+) efflux antiporter 4 [Cocos nucifera]|uniref:Putative K(+) efflux antiporter 4 n=1 Tax=Cocos nucifera TaxID=13894 RepID=A0A8K0N2R0_COCNU|nr:putative K(+) efflux antiporter 4 [Cocos nucifera]